MKEEFDRVKLEMSRKKEAKEREELREKLKSVSESKH